MAAAGTADRARAGASAPGRVLLISDLHLDPRRPDLSRAFFDFLATTATGAQALYILGDFFDVWIGDDDDTPLWREVSAALRRLHESGTAIHLMHGNRDFLLGARYAEACGATLIQEPYLLEHAGRRYLLLHGDVLCTRDEGYMAFRRQVRDPAWQEAFLARPLAERRAFAAEARARSRSMSSNKSADIMDVTQAEVEGLLRDRGVDIMIHGHTHRPAVHDFDCGGKPCRRIVLSDWDAVDRPLYLEL